MHAAYPRLEHDHKLPKPNQALPVCYAHDYKDEKSTLEPRTYELGKVTCRKCIRVVGKYQQLEAVLAMAHSLTDGAN